MLPRRHRLHRAEEFRVVVRSGVRVGGRHVVVHVRLASGTADGSGPGAACSRVGLVVGRSVGSAVTRNRVSRRLRAHFADRLRDLPPGLDIVVRALPQAAAADFATLCGDTDQCLRKALTRVGQRPRTPSGSPL